jgi:hypothetical protein
MILVKDIAWTAGFIEGEGYFSQIRNCAHLEVSQVEKEPIEKLHQLFGGTILLVHRKQPTVEKDYYRWGIYGPNAIGLMMTIYDLMSPKRQQKIGEIINIWESAPGKGIYNHLPNSERRNRAISDGMKRSIAKRKELGIYIN